MDDTEMNTPVEKGERECHKLATDIAFENLRVAIFVW